MAPGQEPGQATSLGFSWADYVSWLVEKHGSLAAVAERLCAHRGYREDVSSIERALRRLRQRGQLEGGTWGTRALSAFGMPEQLDERARWMGAYHSRFTDLPVSFCLDFLRIWDRPPMSEAPALAGWLALAHASCALRSNQREQASMHLQRVKAIQKALAPDALCEYLLVEAFQASGRDRVRREQLFSAFETAVQGPMREEDRLCLQARWIDQRAYALNQESEGNAGYEAAERLYRSLPDEGAPPFARCRRANGLAYARWKLGFPEEGAALALAASQHAGDGGHLRLRAMALNMYARIVEGAEGAVARERALAIAKRLDDESLRLRFERAKNATEKQ